MKKYLPLVIAILLSIIITPSCKKSDSGDGTRPEIELLGLNPLYWAKEYPYEDPGAIAYDISPAGDTVDLTDFIIITNEVDVSAVGNYVVKYNVEDESGEKAEEKIRDVKVVIGK